MSDTVTPGDHSGTISGDSNPPPTIIQRQVHNISRRDIDPDALKVLYRLARQRYTAYLVGGGVRDLILGRKPKDFDVATDAHLNQIKDIFRNCIIIGRRFRLAHIKYGEKIIETSTFRRAPITNNGPIGPDDDLFQRDDNLFGTPAEDARRRDFTVNGLFYDIETFGVIDYVGGMEDLAKKQIRSIGDPDIRFREDPIRMIRAVRFASRLGFTIEENTMAAICRQRDELAKASTARLLEEIIRLFAFSSGQAAVRLLYQTGLLKLVLPEIAAHLDKKGGESSRLWSYLKALDAGDTVTPESTPPLIFAALFYDAVIGDALNGGQMEPQRFFDTIRAFVTPIANRLKFPRRMTDRIIRILTSQARLSLPVSARGPRARFALQEWFPESLALREIHLAARDESPEQLKPWMELFAARVDNPESQHRPSRRHDHGPNGQPKGNNQTLKNSHNSDQSASKAISPDADNKPTEANASSESLPGQGLSRSARRRRNRRRHQLDRKANANQASMQAEPGQTVPVQPDIQDEKVSIRQDNPTEPASEPAVQPALPNTEAQIEKAPAGRQRPARRRRHKRSNVPSDNGKADAVKETNTESTNESSHVGSTDQSKRMDSEKPLSVQDFYQPKKVTRVPRSPRSTEDKPNNSSPNVDRPKPPTRDARPDAHDGPSHWLDEI